MTFFNEQKSVPDFLQLFHVSFELTIFFTYFCQWIRYLDTESIIHFSRIFYVVFLSHLYGIWDKANYFYYDVLEYWWFLWFRHFHCDIRRLVSPRKLGKLQSASETIIFNLSTINIKFAKMLEILKIPENVKILQDSNMETAERSPHFFLQIV